MEFSSSASSTTLYTGDIQSDYTNSATRRVDEEFWSWNTNEDFLLIRCGNRTRVIYFEEIIKVERITSNVIKLVTYPLIKMQRTRRIYNLSVTNTQEFGAFERDFLGALQPKRPPHGYKIPSNANITATIRRPKMLVLINPFSGQRRALDLWLEYSEPIFAEGNVLYDLVSTFGPGHATKLIRELDLDAYGGVAIVSGDGLISETLIGLLTRQDYKRAPKFPILHIPGGTGNGLATSVAFQSNEPFPPRGVFCKEMALMISRPRYRPLRLYHVEIGGGNYGGGVDHYRSSPSTHMPMFMSASWGLIADIDLASERFRCMGPIRYHIEAFIRVLCLPSVACYRARISYIPVHEEDLSPKKTTIKASAERSDFGEGHFECADVSEYSPVGNDEYTSKEKEAICNHMEIDGGECEETGSVEEAFRGTHLIDIDGISRTEAPRLVEPVPSNWETIEGEFVFVCLTSTSHLGSDLPYSPCARLEEDIFYLSFVEWRLLKSRFHMAQLLITIDRGSHLDHHDCFKLIPVRACRVEPAPGVGGHVAIDGEACESGAPFQVCATSLQATVITRQARNH